VAAGHDLVIVAHGDLPQATGLRRFEDTAAVTLVPDRRDDGTNVLAVPASAATFTFAYGAGSFARHLAEADRLGLHVTVARIPELQWDVDTPDDLPEPIPT
jgi:2-phospho-L-lactate guanylyltransferase